jgi:hypothetical protein
MGSIHAELCFANPVVFVGVRVSVTAPSNLVPELAQGSAMIGKLQSVRHCRTPGKARFALMGT